MDEEIGFYMDGRMIGLVPREAVRATATAALEHSDGLKAQSDTAVHHHFARRSSAQFHTPKWPTASSSVQSDQSPLSRRYRKATRMHA